MPLRASAVLFLFATLLKAVDLPYFQVVPEGGGWAAVLSSVGFEPGSPARIVVLRHGSEEAGRWKDLVRAGTILILEGDSPLSRSFGFGPTTDQVTVAGVIDIHNPELAITWEHRVQIPVTAVPADALVFCKEKRTGTPLMAGFR